MIAAHTIACWVYVMCLSLLLRCSRACWVRALCPPPPPAPPLSRSPCLLASLQHSYSIIFEFVFRIGFYRYFTRYRLKLSHCQPERYCGQGDGLAASYFLLSLRPYLVYCNYCAMFKYGINPYHFFGVCAAFEALFLCPLTGRGSLAY